MNHVGASVSSHEQIPADESFHWVTQGYLGQLSRLSHWSRKINPCDWFNETDKENTKDVHTCIIWQEHVNIEQTKYDKCEIYEQTDSLDGAVIAVVAPDDV